MKGFTLKVSFPGRLTSCEICYDSDEKKRELLESMKPFARPVEYESRLPELPQHHSCVLASDL